MLSNMNTVTPYGTHEATAAGIISQWRSMTVEAQIAAITKAVEWGMGNCYDKYLYINGAWLRITKIMNVALLTEKSERRYTKTGKPLTLEVVIWNAVHSYMMCCKRDAIKKRKYIGYVIEDYESGEQSGYADWRFADSYDMEREVMIHEMMEVIERVIAARNATDREIWRLWVKGYTERGIASEIGIMSNVAVHKRLDKMRKALTEALRAYWEP